MLEDRLLSPVTCQRLRASLLAPHIDAFADWLFQRGYAALTITGHLRALAAWAAWMPKRGLPIAEAASSIDLLGAELAAGRVKYARGPSDASRTAAALLVAFLRERGVIPPAAHELSAVERSPVLAEYRAWMVQVRGLRVSSVDVYQGVLVDLLARVGEDAGTYDAASLRAFVLERAKPHGVQRAKSIATAVRTFLRFLAATGRCSTALVDAIPGYAAWRLDTTPRFLEPSDLEKVLLACQSDTASRRRERAVVLLLARLGLRAGEVAELRLEDIDWTNGQILVRGKGRRRERLPLPQEVGDAILAYLREDRPRLSTTHVFARVSAPFGPLTRASVTHVARGALRRAGVVGPTNGAHLFRHSAATAMLRAGASLVGVGAVLRHRSPSTTAHYAKVDFGRLHEIALPWPEVTPC